jgi:tRNA-splicing ligase RtcB
MTHKKIYGEHDERTLARLDRCLASGSAAAAVLCADGHLGYAHPIGGVVGYTDHISISGVGFDIACGNMAVRLDVPYAEVKDSVGPILQDVARVVSFGIGRKNAERVDHDLFDSPLWQAAEVSHLKEMARAQLGTVGSGNHYVDLFHDEEDQVWIGVHFGSRGLGHKTTTKYLELAGAKDGMEVDPALLAADSDLGRGYLAVSNWAGFMPMQGVSGSSRRRARSSAATLRSRCITITTSSGARRMTGLTCGWCARAQRRPFPASMALLAARWAMMR